MAIPSFTVTFTQGASSVSLPSPTPDCDGPVTIPGVAHLTQGGSLVQYQVGPAYWQGSLNFDFVTNAQKDAFEAFWRTNWGQAVTYTDASGNTFSAHFMDTALPLHKLYSDLWQFKLQVRLDSVLK